MFDYILNLNPTNLVSFHYGDSEMHLINWNQWFSVRCGQPHAQRSQITWHIRRCQRALKTLWHFTHLLFHISVNSHSSLLKFSNQSEANQPIKRNYNGIQLTSWMQTFKYLKVKVKLKLSAFSYHAKGITSRGPRHFGNWPKYYSSIISLRFSIDFSGFQ